MTRARPTDIVADLDNEAAQALTDQAHPKHRRLLAVLEAVAQRRARGAASAEVVVYTADLTDLPALVAHLQSSGVRVERV